jgi:phospholipid/cholesterol/gamma-HCH transport system substrate-binding protein
VKGQTLGAAIKLIIFALVTIMSTIVLGIVISNRTVGGSHESFKANFADVTDLITGNDVRLAGVRVGTVNSIKVVTEGAKNYAQVGFNVSKDVANEAMLDNTQVRVEYLNLVGQRYINIVPMPGGDGHQQLPGSTIPISRTRPAVDLTALFNGFKPLFRALTPQDVNSFALEVIKTLQGEGGTVQSLLSRTASLTNTVATRDAAIGHVIDNLVTVLGTVQKRNQGLNETIDQLQRLVSGLAADRGTIAASLSNIDGLANSSSQLIAGIRPYLPSDLRSLARLASNLNTTKDVVNKKQNALAAFLEREPAKLNRIIRTASYGGYFNFWVCQISAVGLQGTSLVPSPSQAPSCPAAS